MSCNSDITTFSRSGSQLTRFPANREVLRVEHEPGLVRLTLAFNDHTMTCRLTPADARALAELLTQTGDAS